jgi:hypothetical protein
MAIVAPLFLIVNLSLCRVGNQDSLGNHPSELKRDGITVASLNPVGLLCPYYSRQPCSCLHGDYLSMQCTLLGSVECT